VSHEGRAAVDIGLSRAIAIGVSLVVALSVTACAVSLVYRVGGRTNVGLARRVSLAAVSYAILVLIVGCHAYFVVPNQYTRYGNWSSLPYSNSMGEVHSVQIERMNSPGAMSREAADNWRRIIAEEQTDFIRNAVILAGVGGILQICTSVLAAKWRSRRRSRLSTSTE
jgi:ABC-type glycerol-3-phosphate transport system permease component